jgi:hypothetical protein
LGMEWSSWTMTFIPFLSVVVFTSKLCAVARVASNIPQPRIAHAAQYKLIFRMDGLAPPHTV